MNKIMAKRVKATIIYSTETGKSEKFAKQLGKLLHFSFFIKVECMEDYDFDGIENESLLLIVTSTFGNGEAPENGKASLFYTLEFLQLYTIFGLTF
jgi:sulfite reductase alpha subunit-like flavoprotein